MSLSPDICPHCGTNYKPIVQEFKSAMQHKYSVGSRVEVDNHKYSGVEGEIVSKIPFTFVAPAYDVRIGDVIAAVSERSMQNALNNAQKKLIRLYLEDKCTDGYLMTKLGVFTWSDAQKFIDRLKRIEKSENIVSEASE